MHQGDDHDRLEKIRQLAEELAASGNPLSRDLGRQIVQEVRATLIHVVGTDHEADAPAYPVDRYSTHLPLAYTDAFGVLYWGAPVGWAQVGYENLMRKVGHPIEEMLDQDWDIPVANTTIDYVLPLHLGDPVVVETVISEIGNRSIKMESRILDAEGRLALRIARVHVAAKRAGGPAEIPAWLRAMGPPRAKASAPQ
jgi:YbgC/YbaW family acyl-CoA thioester hydrolase